MRKQRPYEWQRIHNYLKETIQRCFDRYYAYIDERFWELILSSSKQSSSSK